MNTKTLQKQVLFVRSRKTAMVLVFVVALASLLLSVFGSILHPHSAHAATTSTLNFQARLMTATGGIVPDGNYNIQFKLYDASTGGTNPWTETYQDVDGSAGTTADDYRVRVKNGYLTVNLGSRTSFPGTINWDQDLWITMNVGGTAVTASPTWDGEMNPRLKLTAVPYAFRAGQLAQYGGTYTSTLSLTSPTVGNQSFVLPDMAAAGTYTLLNNANGIQNGTSLQTNASIAIQSANDANVTLYLKQRATQSVSSLLIQNSSGADVFKIDEFGGLRQSNGANFSKNIGVGDVNAATSNIALRLYTGADANTGIEIHSNSGSQTGDLLVAQGINSSTLTYAAAGTFRLLTGTSQTAPAQTVTLANTSGTQIDGVLINRNGAAGTTTNGLNVTGSGGTLSNGILVNQNGGTLTNGVAFSGTIGTDINRTSGTLSLNGAGGIDLRTAGATRASLSSTGAAVFKNGTDSIAGFDIQNSGGGSLLTADTAGSNLRLLSNNAATLSSWVSTTAMNVGTAGAGQARARGASIAANGYLYQIGGNDGSGTTITTVQYAKLNADGSVGTWASTTALPAARRQFQPVVANGYLYVIGGRDGSNATWDTAYYAKLNNDGTVGVWNTTTSLNNSGSAPRFEAATIAYNGFMYVLGGFNGSVSAQTTTLYAKIQPNGTLGSWSTNTVLPTGMTNQNAVIANGYVYLAGGSTVLAGGDDDDIFYAKLNADGTIGAWTDQAGVLNSTGGGEDDYLTYVLNGYLYVIGGDSFGSRSVVFPLNANGSVGTVTDLANLPNSHIGEAGYAQANGYLYIVGGSSAADGGGTVRNSVYYASSPRVSIGGSLDLVGLGGENLAEGGSGGNLTAGNTQIVGTLQVQDQASFLRGANITGALSVNGDVGIKSTANSTTAFWVQGASSTVPLFSVDTQNSQVQITTTSATSPALALRNSDGTAALEFRAGGTGQNNNFIGVNSGSVVTTGFNNISFGNYALNQITTGSRNVAVGNSALNSITTGSFNTAVGNSALYFNTGDNNSAFGNESLKANTTGSNNTALGEISLMNNTTGSNNTAVGMSALNSNNASNNTAVGSAALAANTTGNYNSATGDSALNSNTTGSFNSAFGQAALKQSVSGDDNAAFGNSALNALTSGFANTAVGTNAGYIDDNSDNFASVASMNNTTILGAYAQAQANNAFILGGAATEAVNVGIGTTKPNNTFSVAPAYYGSYMNGYKTASQSTTTVTGAAGTVFTSGMVGSDLIFANGISARVTAFVSATQLTVTPSQTVAAQNYRIHYAGFNVTSAGLVGVGLQSPTYTLDVTGDINTSANLRSGGTIRLDNAGALSNITGYTQSSGTFVQTFSLAGAGTAATINLTNASASQTNGILVNRNAAGGTTTNGINITNAAGTLTNGLAFTGTTTGNDVNRGSGTLTLGGASGVSLRNGTTPIASIDSASLTVAANMNFTMAAGSGQFIQNYNGASSSDAATINVNAGGSTASGLTISKTGVGTLDAALWLSATGGANTDMIHLIGTSTNGIMFQSTHTYDINRTSGTLRLNGPAGVAITGGTGNIVLGTSDTTGTLLVLDTKTDAVEPTGVDGSMYYNSLLRSMRCYANGVWRDCNYTSLRAEWSLLEDFNSETVTAGTGASLGNVGDKGWTAIATGGATMSKVNVSTATEDRDRFGVMSFTTTTTASSGMSLNLGQTSVAGTPSNLTVEFDLATVTDNTSAAIRIGLLDTTTNTAPTDGMYFQFDTATDATNWYRCTANGGTRTCTSTGIAKAAAGTYQRLKFQVNAVGTQVDYYINETSAGSNTTNLPASTVAHGPTINIHSPGTTAKTFKMDYFQMKRNLTTLR